MTNLPAFSYTSPCRGRVWMCSILPWPCAESQMRQTDRITSLQGRRGQRSVWKVGDELCRDRNVSVVLRMVIAHAFSLL